MAYEKKSIRAIIDDVNSRRVYLPAIQRKYVWGDSQITRLMDSIMLGYPIGTFLFWKVKKTIVNQKEYSMYEFIKDYHDRDMYKNPAAAQPFPVGSGDETIWAVLDGQQRLTSLYIALQGSMSRKLPNKRWKNDDAFPKKELYFDLHSEKTDDEDISYEFRFLTAEEAAKNKDDKLYVAVSPMVYYRYKGGNFDSSSKAELRKYIVIAQVRQIFGTASNSALTSIREALKAASSNSFSMKNLNGIRFTGDRTLRYTADEIDAMFDTYEIGAYTFMLLSLLYPNLKYSQKGFHQDHMHPYTGFEEGKIKDLVLPDGTVMWRRCAC